MALPVIYLKKTGTPGVCGVTVTPTSTRRQHFIRWEVVNGCDDDPTKTHDLELRDFRLFGSERPEKARLDSDGESVPIPALCRMNGEKTVLGCFVLQNASTGWYRFRVMIDKKLADDPEMEIQN